MYALKGPHILDVILRACSAVNALYMFALKGPHIIEQDNVLFEMNIFIISPVRA
jgi:hypothetical protein